MKTRLALLGVACVAVVAMGDVVAQLAAGVAFLGLAFFGIGTILGAERVQGPAATAFAGGMVVHFTAAWLHHVLTVEVIRAALGQPWLLPVAGALVVLVALAFVMRLVGRAMKQAPMEARQKPLVRRRADVRRDRLLSRDPFALPRETSNEGDEAGLLGPRRVER